MSEIIKAFYLLALVFILLSVLANISPNFPKIPGDIYIDRPGIKIYIPFVSALIISVVLTLVFNFFRK